jgi:hypothetical protein
MAVYRRYSEYIILNVIQFIIIIIGLMSEERNIFLSFSRLIELIHFPGPVTNYRFTGRNSVIM